MLKGPRRHHLQLTATRTDPTDTGESQSMKKAPAVGGRPGLSVGGRDVGGCPDASILPKDG